MNILVTGHGRHGKDTFCEVLRYHGLTFTSSSLQAAKNYIFPLWGKYRYDTIEECYNDRHTGDNRAIWYKLIQEYNTPDKSRLARDILYRNDVYCGMRCKEELSACDRIYLFDIKIWVDASDRLPPESSDSMTITKDMCDIVIENNGSLDEFLSKIAYLANILTCANKTEVLI
mgnify:CR=1 FL=1